MSDDSTITTTNPEGLFSRLSRVMYVEVERDGKKQTVAFETLTVDELTDLWMNEEGVVSLARMLYVVDKFSALREFLHQEGYVMV